MKFVKLYEEWNKERFSSKEEQKAFYRKPMSPVETRLYNPNQLKGFDIPDEIIEKMKSWNVIMKSPWSNSFYSSEDISWNSKPDGSFRVSDHWNFETKGKKHCLTDGPVKNHTNFSLGKFNQKTGKYNILLSVPKDSVNKKIEIRKNKKEFMINPEMIELKSNFKNRVLNKEIFAEVVDRGKTYKGIVRKYTGRELKIENEMGEKIWGENYLDGQVIRLFDKEGNTILDPFDVKFESRRPLGDLRLFNNEELADIKNELQSVASAYGIRDINDRVQTLTQHTWERTLNDCQSFYYINCYRNAFIEIYFFGEKEERKELLEDLKGLLIRLKSIYGFDHINSWKGISHEVRENEHMDEYLEINITFTKSDSNEGFFNFFKKETEYDKMLNQFIERLEKVSGKSPYQIKKLNGRDEFPFWYFDIKDRLVTNEYYTIVYLIKFADIHIMISSAEARKGNSTKYRKSKYPYRIFMGNESVAEEIRVEDSKESNRKKLFELTDKIYKQTKEIDRIEKLKVEINPSADLL